jgi:peptidoglycan/LPS O-acetylase OafA/YrhL
MSAASPSAPSQTIAPFAPPAPTSGRPHARGASYRGDIEGLRGIAVLLVVAYHAGIQRVSGGFAGVDVFFVLSGYLITGILVDQVTRTGRIDYVQFYARRMRRLLPAVTLTLLAVLAASAILLGPMERIEPALSAIATALYSSNLFFLSRAIDYFASSAEQNPLLHTWSLAVEEQFYLVWPFLVFVGWRFGRSRRRLALLMGVFSLASFAGCVLLTYKRQPWAFFGTPARAWEFGLGGIATLLPAMRGDLARTVWRWLGWIGLALVVGTAFVLRTTIPFPGYAALAPVVGTTLALIAGTMSDDRLSVRSVLDTRVLRWIGGRSYAWYLWHWPVLVFGAVLWPKMALPGRVACVVVALALAAATTALVENPLRFLPWLVARPRRSIAMGLACTIGAAAIAFGAQRAAVARGGTFWRAERDRNRLAGTGCTLDPEEVTPRFCTFGDPRSSTTVVLFGDSHAAQWFSAVDSVARLRHFKLLTLTKYSCSVARVAVWNIGEARRFVECEQWRDLAIRELLALHPSQVVIGQFARRGAVRVTDSGALDSLSATGWTVALRSTLATLDSAGIGTLLLTDSPETRVAVPQCLSRAEHRGRPASVCAVARAVAVDSLSRQADVDASRGLANVRQLDLTDRICGPTTCEPIRDGIVVYHDGNHLSDAYVRMLTPALDSAIVALAASQRPLVR